MTAPLGHSLCPRLFGDASLRTLQSDMFDGSQNFLR